MVAGTRIPSWIVVAYAVALSVIIAWPCMFGLSFMAFDRPDSNSTSMPYIFVACVGLYPLLPLAAVTGSFLAYKRAHKRLAYVLMAVSLLPFAALVLFIVSTPIMMIISILIGTY